MAAPGQQQHRWSIGRPIRIGGSIDFRTVCVYMLAARWEEQASSNEDLMGSLGAGGDAAIANSLLFGTH